MSEVKQVKKLLPFSLQDALAGKPVVTRDGFLVANISITRPEHYSNPLTGIIEKRGHKCWSLKGEYLVKGEHRYDLFMLDEQ